MKFISIDYYISGNSVLKYPRKKFVNAASNEEKKKFRKRQGRIISRIPKDFTVAVVDESIFIHDSLVRRKMWTADRISPIVTMTGSHQRTCVFGTLSIDGSNFFVSMMSSTNMHF